MHLALLFLVLFAPPAFCQSQSQLATLQESPWSVRLRKTADEQKRADIWLKSLTDKVQRSSAYEQLKSNQERNSLNNREFSVVFDVTAAGGLVNIHLSKPSNVAKIDELVVDLVKELAPVESVPAEIAGKKRIQLIFHNDSFLTLEAACGGFR